jgi:hypothetical protein
MRKRLELGAAFAGGAVFFTYCGKYVLYALPYAVGTVVSISMVASGFLLAVAGGFLLWRFLGVLLTRPGAISRFLKMLTIKEMTKKSPGDVRKFTWDWL